MRCAFAIALAAAVGCTQSAGDDAGSGGNAGAGGEQNAGGGGGEQSGGHSGGAAGASNAGGSSGGNAGSGSGGAHAGGASGNGPVDASASVDAPAGSSIDARPAYDLGPDIHLWLDVAPFTPPNYMVQKLSRTTSWNGELATSFTFGWQDPDPPDLNPGEIVTFGLTDGAAQSHSAPHAHEWRVKRGGWTETGRNWGDPTDITGAKYLSFWVRVTGPSPPNILVSMRSSDDTCSARLMGYATPGGELGVLVRRYNNNWNDGAWHEVIIPTVDITEGKPACEHVTELVFRGGSLDYYFTFDFDFLLDDIGFYY